MSITDRRKGDRRASAQPERAMVIVDGLVTVVSRLIWGGTIVWCASLFRDAAIAFAGHETSAAIALSLITKIGGSQWAAYGTAGGGIVYGLYERRIRRRNIERLTGEKSQLEKSVDKKRSSSKLLVDGRTRPEDK